MLSIIDRIRDELPQLIVGVRLSVFDSCRSPAAGKSGQPMDYEQLAAVRVRLRRVGRRSDADRPHRAARADADARRARRGDRSTSRAAARTTIRTCSGRRSSRRPTATCRPRIRWWASARQIHAVRECKAALPKMPLVGTGYSYLQEYLPNVAQAVVREGWVDFVGLGRMVLSYPELPADTLAGRAAKPQADLPHVQRLHDGAAQRPDLRLLPARSALQGAARAREARGDQAAVAMRGDERDTRCRHSDRQHFRMLSRASI